MKSMLSRAEWRSLKQGVRLSDDYRKHLAVRISRKLSLAVELLNDPRVAHLLGDMDALAQRLYQNETFRQSILFGICGPHDLSPITLDKNKAHYYGE